MAALLLLAGCGGLLGGGSDTATPGPNQTAAGPDVDVNASNLPEGWGTSGINNLSTAIRNHEFRLPQQPFRSSLSTPEIDGTFLSNPVTLARGSSGVARTWLYQDGNTSTQWWGAQEYAAQVTEDENGTRYRWSSGATRLVESGRQSISAEQSLLSGLLGLSEYRLNSTGSINGTTTYTYVTTSTNRTILNGTSGDVTEVLENSIEVTVDEQGIIRNISGSLAVDTASGINSGEVSYSVRRSGTIDIGQPSWLADTPQYDVSVVDGGAALRVNHLAGPRLESGTNLYLRTASQETFVTTIAPHEPRGEFYVSLESDPLELRSTTSIPTGTVNITEYGPGLLLYETSTGSYQFGLAFGAEN